MARGISKYRRDMRSTSLWLRVIPDAGGSLGLLYSSWRNLGNVWICRRFTRCALLSLTTRRRLGLLLVRRSSFIISPRFRRNLSGHWLTLALGKGWNQTRIQAIKGMQPLKTFLKTHSLIYKFRSWASTSFLWKAIHMPANLTRPNMSRRKTNCNLPLCHWASWGSKERLSKN